MKRIEMKRTKIIGILLCVSLIIGIMFPVIGVAAKPVGGIVTNVTIKNSHGEEPDKMTQWDSIYVHMDWAIPDNYVEAGDEMLIQLPPELRFVDDMEFDILDDDGNLVAKAYCSKDDKTVKVVFTDYPEKNSGVHGTLWFATYIESSQVENGQTITPEFIIENEVLTGNGFEYEMDIADEDGKVDKHGYFEEDKSKIQYSLKIGMAKEEIKAAVVSDRLISDGLSYDKGSFQIYEVDWVISGTGAWAAENHVLVTDIQPVFDDGDRGFTIEFGDVPVERGYLVRYAVDISYEALPGEIFENKATLTSEGEEIDSDVAYTQYQTGGGTGNGYVGKIILTKKDVDGKVLEGARFDVIRTSTGKSVGEIITGADGIGSIEGLLIDNYQIIETKAPEGYKLDETPIIVKAEDFNDDKIFCLEVENVPLEEVTPSPKPSPEPNPEPSPKPSPSPSPSPAPSKTPTPSKKPNNNRGGNQNGKGPSNSGKVFGVSSVKTADANEIIPVVIMLILAIVGIIYGTVALRKERKNNKK